MIKRFKVRTIVRAVTGVTALIAVGAVFQNCGRVSIVSANQSPLTATLAASGAPVVSMSENYVMTTLNHPVSVKVDNGLINSNISFSQSTVQPSIDTGSGVATIDPSTKMLTFTPKIGFRGSIATTLYSVQGTITNIQKLTFVVSDPVLSFRPALAVRGPECILCHAVIQGDFISDFGFKSSVETGPDLFMTSDNANDSWLSAFAIADSQELSLSTATIVGKLAVPKIDLTQLDKTVSRSWFPLKTTAGAPTPTPVPSTFILPSPTTETPAINSFANFISSRGQAPVNVDFQGVSELSSIYIGAPTTADILTAAQMPSGSKMNFFKNLTTDPDLSGISHIQTANRLDYYGNSQTAPLVCEGDLFVDGVVLLDHVHIQTTYGCRIYSTHSVFVQGPISFSNQTALTNVEISSAVGVFMGFGYCTDCLNATTQGYANQNTLEARLNVIDYEDGAIKAFRTRSYDDEVSAVMADYNLTTDTPTSLPPSSITPANVKSFYASQGLFVNQYDGTDTFLNESKTTFSRVLLNGPIVMSRYGGDFQGIVIAEFAMWRANAFTFDFDPVFTGVSLLPFLDFTKILNIPVQ